MLGVLGVLKLIKPYLFISNHLQYNTVVEKFSNFLVKYRVDTTPIYGINLNASIIFLILKTKLKIRKKKRTSTEKNFYLLFVYIDYTYTL